MKKSNLNLDVLLDKISDEEVNVAVDNLRAAWGGDEDHGDKDCDKHEHEHEEDECECEEKREGNNGLHLGNCKH